MNINNHTIITVHWPFRYSFISRNSRYYYKYESISVILKLNYNFIVYSNLESLNLCRFRLRYFSQVLDSEETVTIRLMYKRNKFADADATCKIIIYLPLFRINMYPGIKLLFEWEAEILSYIFLHSDLSCYVWNNTNCYKHPVWNVESFLRSRLLRGDFSSRIP